MNVQNTILLTMFFIATHTTPFSFGLPPKLLSSLEKVGEKELKKDDAVKKELVFFWGTWCKECKEKLTDKLPKMNARKDLRVLTINMDSNPRRAKHYIKKQKLQLPVFQDKKRDLVKQLKVFAVPHWAVYEKDSKSGSWSLVDAAAAYDEARVQKALQ